MALPAPCKRHFIPTFDSFFNENKKRKLNSQQCQELLPPSRFPADPEAREALVRQAQDNELDRIKLVEAASYGIQPAVSTQYEKPLSTEERELTDILKRPKFKAKPVPRTTYYTPATALKSVDQRVTLPQPFALHTDVRGTEKQYRRAEELQRQQREDDRRRNFQAKPVPTYSQSSECSSQSYDSVLGRLQHSTVPEPFTLHSSLRSEERQAFETRLRQKEEIKAQVQAREQEERRKQEEAELRQLRQKTVFKAQPIFRPGAFVPPRTRAKARSPPLSQESVSQGSFLSQDWSFFKE